MKKALISFLEFVGELTHFFLTVLKSSVTRPFYPHHFFEQVVYLGVGSLSITLVIGLTMGLVMTLNFGHGLAKFGGTLYVPAVVGLSLAREMAPIFTSLLVAGRVGSAIAAEIGSMNVTQQVDALRALGTSPFRVLIVPRFWALCLSLPLLSSLSCLMGFFGGLLICLYEFDISWGLYWSKVLSTVKIHDFLSGLIKSFFFAMIIATISSFQGLRTKDGTQGVGLSTRWSVVTSSILILISDFFLSKIFLSIWKS